MRRQARRDRRSVVPDRSGRQWAGWLSGLLLVLASTRLPAATGPELPPTPQWLPFVLHDADDGLPSSRVTALAQDAGGWLWVGTSEGLARWDGLRFEGYAPSAGLPMPVTELEITADDALWVAIEGGGLWRLAADRQDWQHYHRGAPAPRTLPGDEVFAVHEQGGALWVGLYAAGMARIVDGVAEPLSAYPEAPEWSPTLLLGEGERLYAGTITAGLQQLALSDGKPRTLAAGRVMHAGLLDAGTLWIAPSRQDLLRIEGEVVESHPMPRVAGAALASFAIGHRSDGDWFATDRGLLQRAAERWQWFAAGAQRGLPDGRIVDLLVDREENLWLAIEGQGLVRIDPPGAPQTVWLGGSARRAAAGERSADGSLLIAFRDGGLARIDPTGVLAWIGPAGAGEPSAILEHAGHWWLGHAEGLSRAPIGDAAGWETVDTVHGATERVDLLLPLPGGGVVASLYGSAVHALDAEGRLLARWAVGEALEGPEVEALALDAAGGLWIAHARGVCRIADPTVAGDCRPVAVLAGQRIRALSPLDAGVLAASADRLVRVSADGAVVTDRMLDMLDGALASGLHATPDGRRWVSTGRGLLLLDGDGGHRWQTQADGLPTGELADRPFQVRGGALLIGSERGLIVRQIDEPPPRDRVPGDWRLQVEGARLLSDYRHGTPRPRLSLHAAQLATAGRAEYHYRLDGPLPQSGSARGAVQLDLGSLPPGDWRLTVESAAAGAPWSRALRIAPPWWQTAAFQLSLLLLILVVAALVFRAWRHRLLLEHRLRLERAQAEWGETLAAEKTEFVATLSHELRNQLQGLGASVALLRLRSSELPTVLTRVETAVGAMAGLLNDALELSRLEGGRLPLRPEPLRLEALARELDEALTVAAAARPGLGCRWQAEVDPLIVTLDRLRFRQIVLNLAGNALRHARAGVDIRLQAVHDPAAGVARLRLRVRDDGPGIPAELKPRLFRRWQRGDGQGPEGSGLGLAICRQLVEAMAGTIAVDSEPGCTVFAVELSLPATVEEVAAPPVGEWLLLDGPEALPMPESLPLRRCASPLVLLTLLDTHAPLAVLVAPTQSVALRPLLPLLRQRHPRLRMLLLATAAMPADQARAREQGYDGLLGLPLTTAALAAALREPGP